MNGVVYHANGEAICPVEVTIAQILDGFMEVPCFECNGGGVFEIAEGHSIKCNRCKGRLTELVAT